MAAFSKILGIVLQLTSLAEAIHGASSGVEKKALVMSVAKQVAPIALQKSGHDPSQSDALVDDAFGAFESVNALVKGLKK